MRKVEVADGGHSAASRSNPSAKMAQPKMFSQPKMMLQPKKGKGKGVVVPGKGQVKGKGLAKGKPVGAVLVRFCHCSHK